MRAIPDNYKSFSELVREDDEKRQIMEHFHHVDGQPMEEVTSSVKELDRIENLVIDSDDYVSVQEHVILNFANFLQRYDIKNIYIQNPPEKVREQIDKIFNKNNIGIEYQKYVEIQEENIRVFHEKLSQKIIGQEIAKKQLVSSLIPLLLEEREKPIVVLLYGNSGIGKTESVKLLADTLGETLFRKQFSMYQNNEFANYLFGGKHSEKSFAKDLLDRDSNVILLDEFDKAAPVFFSAFYQLFDEGIFVDRNYLLKLKKSVIICTSNFHSIQEIEKTLGSAILGRFDNVIHFENLDDFVKNKIGNKLFTELSEKYETKFGKALPENAINSLKRQFSKYTNARQIRSEIEKVLAYYYMNELLK